VDQRICDWCTRTSRRQTRVSCAGTYSLNGSRRVCGAHRILELSPTCQVCGAAAYARVDPSPADVPSILADLTLLAGDLRVADPSFDTNDLIAALADASLRHARMRPESYPPIGRTA
jgi:hypothetical protein